MCHRKPKLLPNLFRLLPEGAPHKRICKLAEMCLNHVWKWNKKLRRYCTIRDIHPFCIFKKEKHKANMFAQEAETCLWEIYHSCFPLPSWVFCTGWRTLLLIFVTHIYVNDYTENTSDHILETHSDRWQYL